jgi:hypothetical protein
MAYKQKPKTMFSVHEWNMCSRCIIGKCYQCTGSYRVEGIGRTGNAYRKCECGCNEDD